MPSIGVKIGLGAGRAGASFVPTEPPVNVAAPLIDALAPAIGDRLTAARGGWIGGQSYAYEWRRDGAPIDGATSQSYDVVADDVGAALTVAVTASNALGDTTVVSAATAAVVTGAPVSETPPSIDDATPFVGDVLIADPGVWSGTPPSFAYQWRDDGVDIPGATASSFTVTFLEIGGAISVAVTATNPGGAATAASAATDAVIDAPANAAPPSIDDATPAYDDLLTADPGTWTGGDLAFAYQWRRDGVDIPGASSETYRVVAGDADAALSVFVVASNPAGAASAVSAATAAVIGPTAPAQVDGVMATPGDGVVVLAWSEPDDGLSPITDYVVQRADAPGGPWTTLADGASATPSHIDMGLVNDAAYYYRIAAVNAFGQGAYSAAATATPTAPAGNTDPNVSAIQSDGWRATYVSPPPGDFDPVGDPKVVTVERQGFDASGAPTVLVEDVTIMKRVRLPYPDEATLTTSDVALSDFIYAGDVIVGGSATNGSTRAYPKPIAMWLDHDRAWWGPGDASVRLAVAHAHARSGRPVAAVEFLASDGTTTISTGPISTMSVATFNMSGLSAPHFAGTFTAAQRATLTDGALVDVWARIYPWVGPVFDVSTDASAYPSASLCPIKALNDASGAYGAIYVYVDPVLGDDDTGVASTSAATAEANPYATIQAAGDGAIPANIAEHGRNNCSGVIMRLEPGTHEHGWYGHTAGDVPMILEAADPAAKATTIYTRTIDSHLQGSLPDQLKIRNLTIQYGVFRIWLDNGAADSVENMLVLENVTGSGGGGAYDAMLHKVGRLYFIESEDDIGFTNMFGSIEKTTIAIGSGAGSIGESTCFAIANKDLATAHGLGIGKGAGDPDAPQTFGEFYGWNHIGHNAGTRGLSIERNIGDRGVAVIGNLLEFYGAFAGAGIWINADGATEPTQNVVMTGNTAAGARFNLLYNDEGGSVDKSGHARFNIATGTWNTKADVFVHPTEGPNAARVGNWSEIYQVGNRGNTFFGAAGGGGAVPGPGSWMGEVNALDSVFGGAVLDWADDRSNDGTDAGGGDYTPGAGYTGSRIAAGLAPYPVDLFGRTIADDGTAVAGAVQRAA